MNAIEQMFFDAWENYFNTYEEKPELTKPWCELELETQKPMGIYRPDFVMGSCIIEIDGHEAHKTKEQRYADYVRERFFIKRGFTVIRFMASEVFLNATECVMDALTISNRVEEVERKSFLWGK